ncbi:MAG: DNA repair protein RecO [Desulfobacterales bacterium]
MSRFSTPAIILRRIDFGDYDLILSLITLNRGKVSAIAKSAKKSTKRFAGILEPFSILDVVCTIGKGRLPVLQEAVLKHPFSVIRSDMTKAAYASYWAELINEWLEDSQRQADIYHLFHYSLAGIDTDLAPEAALSILFQMRFAALSGYGPNLTHCSFCSKGLDDIKSSKVAFDIKRGGLVCDACSPGISGRFSLSKGTIKQLLWIESGDLIKAKRIRLDPLAIKESLDFLEAFVPYHLGKAPRSLTFLRQIRS